MFFLGNTALSSTQNPLYRRKNGNSGFSLCEMKEQAYLGLKITSKSNISDVISSFQRTFQEPSKSKEQAYVSPIRLKDTYYPAA